MNVPDGWKLVPIKPTLEMLEATISTYPDWCDANVGTIKRLSCSIYFDMLSAAPNCGACPGDGSICAKACKVEGDSPAAPVAAPAPSDADKRDAERYRWLRESGEIVASHCGKGVAIPMYTPGALHKLQLDGMIDAQLRAAQADPFAGIAADFASPDMLTTQEPPCANT